MTESKPVSAEDLELVQRMQKALPFHGRKELQDVLQWARTEIRDAESAAYRRAIEDAAKVTKSYANAWVVDEIRKLAEGK